MCVFLCNKSFCLSVFRVLSVFYFNHKTCTRWRRWVSLSDRAESDVDRRNKRNRPTLSPEAIQPCVPGLGLNRIWKRQKKARRCRSTADDRRVESSYFAISVHFVRFIVLWINVTAGVFLRIKMRQISSKSMKDRYRSFNRNLYTILSCLTSWSTVILIKLLHSNMIIQIAACRIG